MDIAGQYSLLKKDILPRVSAVLESGRYIMGPEVAMFEQRFARFCRAKYCIGTASGTESLIIALKTLGIGPGDEVITVPNTFTATAEAIYFVGARIVFCDVEGKTMNMDPDALKGKITRKTKAVIPVHFHGNPADMDRIYAVTKPRNIAVIEDAAQAQGARYKGKIIGSLRSEFTCFSFHPVKNLGSAGDAGALTTPKKRLADMARLLINHGRTSHNRHIVIGFTGRMDTIQAAVLLAKLPYLPEWHRKRKKLVEYYKKKLPGQCRTIESTQFAESAHHVFSVLVDNRTRLASFLEKNGVETGMHYPIPLHLQKAYRHLGYKKGDFPRAEDYAEKTISLPLYPHMKYSDIDRIASLIKKYHENT